MDKQKLAEIAARFATAAPAQSIEPLGNGLINDTFKVTTEGDAPDYVFQRINNAIFTDVEGLQKNIEAVTRHIRRALEADGTPDIDRRVLTFVPLRDSDKTFYHDEATDTYWRMSVMISDSVTKSEVNPQSAYEAGREFGRFEAMLVDVPEKLVETIPDFHNMELRVSQLREAIEADRAGRLESVRPIVDDLMRRADDMCLAEKLHREGKLPKRACHCDTKVNNMLFDRDGNVLCVIDLDTVMPSYVFSDFGDFLRTGASTVAEDSPEYDAIDFRLDIFEAFARGYLESAGAFLTPVEIENLPYAAALFPYMQAVRFFTDYLNGDTYYKTTYPEHNLVRTLNQIRLLERVEALTPRMREIIAGLAPKA